MRTLNARSHRQGRRATLLGSRILVGHNVAAHMLDVTRNAVEFAYAKGKLRAARVGTRRMFDLEDVLALRAEMQGKTRRGPKARKQSKQWGRILRAERCNSVLRALLEQTNG